ncbi:hypothetical protein P8935_08675 [Telmatobacter sp. DSM 110680]|uniref:Uncharacterized protein n=1 Tax=Telmatobacter sp. DSM 110680 TaxID=3036704 RepID=A0AAU7DQ12_9BACT
MERKSPASVIRALSLLLLAATTCALAQEHKPVHLTGLINDYVPLLTTVKGSPYEMHGQWSMDLDPEMGTAEFSADMTMSSFGKTATGAVDPTQPLQGPHTHHIKVTNARITWNMDGCPAYATPTQMGFQISKTVSLLTGNGSNGGFETNPPSSTLQVCITGGLDVPFSVTNSNITMVFTGPATGHFGTQAIHGVVRGTSTDSIRNDR